MSGGPIASGGQGGDDKPVQKWLDSQLARMLREAGAEPSDPEFDTELDTDPTVDAYDEEGETELDPRLAERWGEPSEDEEEFETELYAAEAFQRARAAGSDEWVDYDDMDTEGEATPVDDGPTTRPIGPAPALQHWTAPPPDPDLEDHPTVIGRPSLVGQTLTSDEGAAPRPLPIHTGGRKPAGLAAWPAPLAEETVPLGDARHLDKTAPSMFPSPEDSGKEQRPYPPSATPPAAARRDVPTAITSSLVGLAFAGLLVLGFVGVLLVWMTSTGRITLPPL